jgi:phosphotransacetylase/acyl dehydratase
MADYTNHTFDEIDVGTSETVTRTVTATEVDALSLAAGDVESFHVRSDDRAAPRAPATQGSAAGAILAGMLNRRLPGPGAAIVASQLQYGGTIRVGDTLTATVTARAKHAEGHRIEFDCRCTNQHDDVLAAGSVTVTAPTRRVAYTNLATPQIVLRHNDGFVPLFGACAYLPAVACAVVHPCDRDSLQGAVDAAAHDLIVPVLVGPEAKIRAVAATEGIDITPFRIVPVEHSHEAAATAVALAREGEVHALMKGSLHTDELMEAVVPSVKGLRTARRITHVFVMDVPTYPRLLLVTDCAININPDLDTKADICRNAIDLAHVLGIDEPRVAILSAVETVTAKLQGTLDAAALCKMADRGQITGGLLDGPLAFDNAISLEAARTKGIVSAVAGRADILLVPDLEAGNILAKQQQYLAGADSAGIVLGTRVPIVLTSRADTVRARLASAAVLKLVAHHQRRQLAALPGAQK